MIAGCSLKVLNIMSTNQIWLEKHFCDWNGISINMWHIVETSQKLRPFYKSVMMFEYILRYEIKKLINETPFCWKSNNFANDNRTAQSIVRLSNLEHFLASVRKLFGRFHHVVCIQINSKRWQTNIEITSISNYFQFDLRTMNSNRQLMVIIIIIIKYYYEYDYVRVFDGIQTKFIANKMAINFFSFFPIEKIA